MYIPAAFNETDPEKLFDTIEQYSFGMLVSQADGVPLVSHLPILLDRTHAPHGCLIGHLARANPQWEQAEGQAALAVFSGPHAYISPSWYQSENVVPTWNYVAVHAYGTFRAIHDRDALLEIVGQYVSIFSRVRSPLPGSSTRRTTMRRNSREPSSVFGSRSTASKENGNSTKTSLATGAKKLSRRSALLTIHTRARSPS